MGAADHDQLRPGQRGWRASVEHGQRTGMVVFQPHRCLPPGGHLRRHAGAQYQVGQGGEGSGPHGADYRTGAGGLVGDLFSRVDMDSGWSTSPFQYWDNPTDQNAHGGVPWVPYYLQQMSQFEQTNGYRLLDYLDVHAYIAPSGLSGSQGDSAMETLRMTSTRATFPWRCRP